jgi:hypothetical protein
MRTLTRRSLLLSTAAATFAATAAPCFAATGTPFKPWQAEIDAVFEFFDEHQFTSAERQRTLYVHPLRSSTSLYETADTAIRGVLDFTVKTSPYKQQRVDMILTINHNLQSQHGSDAAGRRRHLDHQWSDDPNISVRRLMTTGNRDDLHTAELCSKVRV